MPAPSRTSRLAAELLLSDFRILASRHLAKLKHREHHAEQREGKTEHARIENRGVIHWFALSGFDGICSCERAGLRLDTSANLLLVPTRHFLELVDCPHHADESQNKTEHPPIENRRFSHVVVLSCSVR